MPQPRPRGPGGRFRAYTPAEKLLLDQMDAVADFRAYLLDPAAQARQRGMHPGSQLFRHYRGTRSQQEFALRYDRAQQETRLYGLEEGFLGRQVERLSGEGTLFLWRELKSTSPVDTGLLVSNWRIGGTVGGVRHQDRVWNPVPYVFDTEYRNRSSRGYIKRAVQKTMAHMASQGMAQFRRNYEKRAAPGRRVVI